jgi:hypothetical protein
VIGHLPLTPLEEQIDTNDRREAVKQFKNKYPHVVVELIDGVVVRGVCQRCEMPVMEDDTGYVYNEDDRSFLCPSCA